MPQLKEIISQDAEIRRIITQLSSADNPKKRRLLSQELYDRILELDPDDNSKRVVQVLLGILSKLKISVDEQQDIIFDLDIDNEDRFLIIKKSSFAKMFEKMKETMRIDVPTPQVNYTPPEIKFTSPEIKVPPAIVKIPEFPAPIVNMNMSEVVSALEEVEKSLEMLATNSKENPLAVRMTDGEDWVEQLVNTMGSINKAVGTYQGSVALKNSAGKTINPSTSEDTGPASGIVSGTKTITTAGTAVQVVATTTECREVIVSADLGNTNPVVVGDSSVVAANGSQRGIVLIPGNAPVTIRINDVSKLYVDAQTNGDELCYAYLT